jgi:hypothetical protein
MVQPCLGSRVCKCFERRDAQAVDAADVDDSRWGGECAGGFEEGCNGLRKLEDALKVEVQDAIPCV